MYDLVKIVIFRRFGSMAVTYSPTGERFTARGLTSGMAERRLLKKIGALPVWTAHYNSEQCKHGVWKGERCFKCEAE